MSGLQKNDCIILEMKQISKRFGAVQALKCVDFSLKNNQIHGLVGENGAGKSTLIKILFGVHSPDEGRIILRDKEVEIRNTHEALKMRIGMVPQEIDLIPELDVAHNIFLGNEPTKLGGLVIDSREIYKNAQILLEEFDCAHLSKVKVCQLNIAMQQIVEIVKCLSWESEIIVMDEPTSSLSLAEIENLFRVIQLLKNRGVSVIYISHYLDEIFEICDEVTILRDGRKVNSHPIQGLTREKLIFDMIGTPNIIKQLYGDTSPHTAKADQVVLEVEDLQPEKFKNSINFRLHKGEIIGLAGQMGSGRTELATALFGAYQVEKGTISVRGKPVDIKNPNQAHRIGVGYVPEDRQLSGFARMLSVADNTVITDVPRICKWRFIRQDKKKTEAINHYIDKLKIKVRSGNVPVSNLSGGNQQKVVISRELFADTDILILDEPTRGVDIGAKAEIYSLIRQLALEGKAIIVISSELPEVFGLSDRVIVLKDFEVLGIFNLDETTPEEISTMVIK